MTKVVSVPIIAAVIVQMILGYVWYDSHLFGKLWLEGIGRTELGGLDAFKLVVTIISSFGFAYVLDSLLTLTGTKDITGVLKLGVTIGLVLIGLTLVTFLLSLGFGKLVMLIAVGHVFMSVVLTGIVLIKLK